MTVWVSVGKSRYRGETYGIEQFLSQYAAYRVLDMIEFIATLPGCRRLTVNEGRRTRARQRDLWGRWLAGTGYLAARPYSSRHDEEQHGNAADLGGPDGEALNAAERAAISEHGPAFGVWFTGLTFSPPEPWHVEADETPYTRVYPIKVTPISKEDEMVTIIGINDGPQAGRGMWVVDWGQKTKWNIVAGVTVEEAYKRRDIMVGEGIAFKDKQAPFLIRSFTDITNR